MKQTNGTFYVFNFYISDKKHKCYRRKKKDWLRLAWLFEDKNKKLNFSKSRDFLCSPSSFPFLLYHFYRSLQWCKWVTVSNFTHLCCHHDTN